MDDALPVLDEVDHQRTLAAVRAKMFGTTPSFPRFERFVVLRRAGEGAMGRVYVAYDPKLDRKVAIKVIRIAGDQDIDRTRRQRLAREAQATAKISHPNVITIHEVGTTDDSLFVVMEYVDGSTLREWLADASRDWAAVRDVFVAAARGLAAAHAHGLVHRDFKPDNVLVGEDGRVKVVDFGLVRLDPDGSITEEPVSGVEPEALTEASTSTATGATMGTPAYMSPEQHLGQVVDARSDQYSYGVALHEAVYGHRPRTSSADPPLDTPPSQRTGSPPWVHEVLARTLSASATDRYPTMQAVVAQLERAPASVQRRWVLGLATAGLVVGAIGLGRALGSGDTSPCPDAQAIVAPAWSDTSRATVRSALVGTGLAYSRATADRVERDLDAYASAWASARNDACHRSLVTAEQPEAVMVARVSCLEERRRHFEELIDVLGRADATVLENATRATGKLPPVDRCSDLAYVQAAVKPPDDPEVAHRISELARRRSRASSLATAGKYDEANVILETLIPELEGLDYAPALARTLLEHGRVQGWLGAYPSQDAALRRAFYTATAVGDDLTAIEAATGLIHSPARRETAEKDDVEWADLTGALIERLGGDPSYREAGRLSAIGQVHYARGEYERALELYAEARRLYALVEGTAAQQSTLWNYEGSAHGRLGKDDEAVRGFTRALDSANRIYGEAHPRVATIATNLATVLRNLGRLDEAEQKLVRAREILVGAYGARHPKIASVLGPLAAVKLDRGRAEEALELFAEVVSIAKEYFGANHREVGSALNNLGYVYSQLGRHAEAEAAFAEAWPIVRDLPGAQEVAASVLNNQGIVYNAQGKFELALDVYGRSLTLTTTLVGEDHRDVAGAHLNIANVLVAQGRLADAQRNLDTALAIFEKAPGDNRVHISGVHYAMGLSFIKAGKRGQAREHLERALALREAVLGPDHPKVAQTREKLVETGGTATH